MLFMYVLIALFFGGLTALSLFFGGHDGPELSHDMETGHGDSGGHGWGGWFSLKVISVFGTAFGAAGAIAMQSPATKPWSLLIALLSGAIIGYLVKTLIHHLRSQEMSGSYHRESLAGQEGTMTLGVVTGGTGEAQFIVDGQMVNMPAKSSDGKPLAQGDRVVVDSVGAVLSVSKKK